MNLLRVFALLAIVAATSCTATGQLAATDADTAAKVFDAPSSGMARVYIVRPGGFVAGGVLTQITADGVIIGSLGPRQYIVVDVPAGQHVFAQLERNNQQTARLDVEPNALYFLSVMIMDEKLVIVDQAEGKRLVLESKRVETLTPQR